MAPPQVKIQIDIHSREVRPRLPVRPNSGSARPQGVRPLDASRVSARERLSNARSERRRRAIDGQPRTGSPPRRPRPDARAHRARLLFAGRCRQPSLLLSRTVDVSQRLLFVSPNSSHAIRGDRGATSCVLQSQRLERPRRTASSTVRSRRRRLRRDAQRTPRRSDPDGRIRPRRRRTTKAHRTAGARGLVVENGATREGSPV